jgi:hypothetical protein
LRSLEALRRLEDIRKRHDGRVLFRGESREYPNRLPSAARYTARDRWIYEAYLVNLTSHVYQQLVAPRIYDYGMAPHFAGKFVGCRDLRDRVGQDSYIELMWMLQALLQHYGRHSWWLDMTFDPRVAMFFASYDAERSALETQGCGYVFWVALADIREDWSPVIDLRDTSNTIAEIVGATAERTRAQAAASMRAVPEHRLQDIPWKTVFHHLRFERSGALTFLNPAWFLPEEPLLKRLDAAEAEYLRLLQSIAVSGHYEGAPAPRDFVELCQTVLKERSQLLA